ncbi:Maf family protein [Evansella sp. LMS18]|uniref:Maf family protein n=1 Tax=Evansella sp. LMS18 TaxID=2924033 RepID=UPI0020D111D9|nr:Maf family protein [Evansella sp. LMS18]UTR11240.1 Maf family protein [Evansella sp. LMS18]
MKPFILASQSPRRKQLLEQVQIPFSVQKSNVDEKMNMEDTPEDIVKTLASQKAEDVFSSAPDSVVLGADTIVVYDGQILGKPADEVEARKTLRMLSGKTHVVYTGVAIVSEEKSLSFCVKTEVEFYELTDEEISAYIESGDPFDKAGSYGIQGIGATLVKRISGDYFAVVGLPVAKVVRALKDFPIIKKAD